MVVNIACKEDDKTGTLEFVGQTQKNQYVCTYVAIYVHSINMYYIHTQLYDYGCQIRKSCRFARDCVSFLHA